MIALFFMSRASFASIVTPLQHVEQSVNEKGRVSINSVDEAVHDDMGTLQSNTPSISTNNAAELEKLNDNIKSEVNQKEYCMKELAKMKALNVELSSRLATLEKRNSTAAQKDTDQHVLKEALANVTAKMGLFSKEITDLKDQNLALKTMNTALTAETDSAKQRTETLIEVLKEALEMKDSLLNDITELNERNNALRNRLTDALSEVSRCPIPEDVEV